MHKRLGIALLLCAVLGAGACGGDDDTAGDDDGGSTTSTTESTGDATTTTAGTDEAGSGDADSVEFGGVTYPTCESLAGQPVVVDGPGTRGCTTDGTTDGVVFGLHANCNDDRIYYYSGRDPMVVVGITGEEWYVGPQSGAPGMVQNGCG